MAALSAVVAAIPIYTQPYTDNVGIGTALPDPSALLELRSSEKGFLIPRMTQLERDAIQQPATGLLIFNSTANAIQYNIGTKFSPVWVSMLYINVDGGSSSGVFWSLLGNDSVDATKNFLGTTNDQPLILKTDSVTRMTLTATGEIIIEGPTSITGQLDLTGITSPLTLDGNAGTPGQVLVSNGPGVTPRYTDSLTLSQLVTTGDVLVGGDLVVSGNATFVDTAYFDVLPSIPLNYGNILVGDSTNRAVPLVPGLEGSLMQISSGRPMWIKPDEAAYWSITGNAGMGSANFLGTLDASDLQLASNGQLRASITALGQFNILIPTSITGSLDLVGPSSPLVLQGNAGIAGQVLVSQGPGTTPIYSDSLTLRSLTVIGPAFFTDTVNFSRLPSIPLNNNHLLVGNANNLATPFPPGGDSTFLAIFDGNVQWFDLGLLLRNTAWIVGGNSSVGSPILGNLDTTGMRDLHLYAGGKPLLTFDGTNYTAALAAPLNLQGASTSLSLDGDPGIAGQVLISQGAGVTPRYTDSLVLSSLTVTGQSRFQDTATFDVFPVFPLLHGNMIVGDSTGKARVLPPGLEGSLMQVYNGQPTWVTPDEANYWSLDGNAGVGTSAFLGTTDANDLRIGTSGALRATFTAGGVLDVQVPTTITGSLNLVGPNSPLQVNGDAGFSGWVLISQGINQTPAYTDSLVLRAAVINSSLTLAGVSSVIMLNGDAGTAGQILVSQGPSATPRYTDTLTLSSLTVTGESFFQDTAHFAVFPDFPLQHGFLITGDSTNRARQFAPGLEGSLLQVYNGQPTWVSPDEANYWSLDGNAGVGPTAFLGTTDANDLRIGTNGALRATFTATGLLDIQVPTSITGSLNLAGSSSPLLLNSDAGVSGWVLISQGPAQTPVYTDSLLLRAVVVNSSLTLDGPSTEFFLNGDAGASGQVLISQGPGATPRYTDTLSLGSLTVTGESYFVDTAHFSVFPDFPLEHGYLIVGDSTNTAVPFAPGLEGSLLQVYNGQPTWVSPDEAQYWSLSGNAGVGPAAFLGTTDANDLRFGTNGGLRMTIGAVDGAVTIESLSGVPSTAPLTANDGLVIADGSGTITKRDKSVLLDLLGIAAGRFENTGATTQFNVVINIPGGFQMDPAASITITPEATSSVSITPFVVAGSRTPTSFTINFPGGLDPGEAINWLVKNP